MTDPAIPPAPTGAPSWLATAGLVLPYIVLIGGAILAGVGKLLGTGTDTLVGALSSMRRVADTKRDGVIEAMQEQIDGLRGMVEQLQSEMTDVRAELEDERRDRAHADRYGWRAYREIVRLDPTTGFPMPVPRPRDPDPLLDVQPPPVP